MMSISSNVCVKLKNEEETTANTVTEDMQPNHTTVDCDGNDHIGCCDQTVNHTTPLYANLIGEHKPNDSAGLVEGVRVSEDITAPQISEVCDGQSTVCGSYVVQQSKSGTTVLDGFVSSNSNDRDCNASSEVVESQGCSGGREGGRSNNVNIPDGTVEGVSSSSCDVFHNMNFVVDNKRTVKVDDDCSSNDCGGKNSENSKPNTPHVYKGGDKSNGGFFECNICFEEVKEPIVTRCGHLFCWVCLHEWLKIGRSYCPVCNAGVTSANVIPLYGRGSEEKDPRTTTEDIPKRPRPNRPEPPPNDSNAVPTNQFSWSLFGGQTASIAFGALPFGFGISFGSGLGTSAPQNQNSQSSEEQLRQTASTLWIIMGMLLLIYIIFFSDI